jgi:hypothetical protein
MPKWLRAIRHEFPGITVSRTGGGHYKLVLPNGQPIFTSSTPSDRRTMRNVRSDVRRALRPTRWGPHTEDPEFVADQMPQEVYSAFEPNVIIERPGEIEPPTKPFGQVLYHFTDTSYLPLILHAGELRRRDSDEFLWATTDPKGDRLSSVGGRGTGREAFIDGRLRAIRFTIDADGFQDGWREAATKHHLSDSATDRADCAMRYKQSTKPWRWRLDPVLVDQCLIEMKGYRDNRWAPVEKFSLIDLPTNIDGFTIIRLGDLIFMSRKTAEVIEYAKPATFADMMEAYEEDFDPEPGDVALPPSPW